MFKDEIIQYLKEWEERLKNLYFGDLTINGMKKEIQILYEDVIKTRAELEFYKDIGNL